MPKVAIVTDSTAYIPDDLVARYQIRVAPQVLIWGDKTYLDGVDIQPDEFYERRRKSPIDPTTSQVTPSKFVEIFSELTEKDFDILAILLSEKLSGTIASAQQAIEMLPKARVEIVDSKTTAMALGFICLAAARASEEGSSLEECRALAVECIPHTGVTFAVDTLEFLHRGGRIGGGTRFLGTALNIKPILELREGVVEPVERVRTRSRRMERLVERTVEKVAGRQPVRLAVLHADAPDEARSLLAAASARLNPIETVFSTVSPVVANHAGPGTVGLAFIAGM